MQLNYEQVSLLMMGELFFVDGGLDIMMIWWEYGVYDMIDDDAQASEMLAKDPAGFHETVQESLRR